MFGCIVSLFCWTWIGYFSLHPVFYLSISIYISFSSHSSFIVFEFMGYTYCTFRLKYGDVTTIIVCNTPRMESTMLLLVFFSSGK